METPARPARQAETSRRQAGAGPGDPESEEKTRLLPFFASAFPPIQTRRANQNITSVGGRATEVCESVYPLESHANRCAAPSAESGGVDQRGVPRATSRISGRPDRRESSRWSSG